MNQNHAPSAGTILFAAGHRFKTDQTGKVSFQSTSTTSAQIQRFCTAIESLGDLTKLPPAVATVLTLPIHDAVLTHQGWRAAVGAILTIYHQGHHLVLDWNLSNGWRDRRFLSPSTRAILDNFPSVPSIQERDWRDARILIQEALVEPSNKKVWDVFLAGASAFWSDKLPGLLWSHCIGFDPLQPLTRKTIARRISGLPLVYTPPVLPKRASLDRAAFLASGYQTKQLFTIREAVEVLLAQRRQKSSRNHFGEVVIPKLTDLLMSAAREGRIQVLLVGFVIDLVENGGLQGELSINSLIAYLLTTLENLATQLLLVDIFTLDSNGWWTLYSEVSKKCDQKQLSKVNATLAAFHDYLDWLGVPPLTRRFGTNGPLLPPRAMVIWSRESHRAAEWLDLQVVDGNCAAAQASLVVLMIEDFMVRVDEVLSLRIGDFKRTLSGWTLLLYPRTRDGKMKSSGVRHPIDIQSAVLKERLHRWIQMRRTQGAVDEDFLFGAPRKAGERHLHAQTYQLVESALKTASGSPDSTSHGSRHRAGSERVEASLMPSMDYVDINPLDQISCGAGQNITSSLRESYIHLFEEPLYQHCLAAHGEGIKQASSDLPPWVGSLEAGILLDHEEPWKHVPAAMPDEEQITFSAVVDVLEDLSLGYAVDSIASRNPMQESEVETVARVTATVLIAIQGKSPREVAGMSSGYFHAHQYFLVNERALIRSARQEKFLEIAEWLNQCNRQKKSELLLKSVVDQWKPAVKNYFLNATEPMEIAAVLQMIKESRMPRSRLLITHAIPFNRLPNELTRLGWNFRPEAKVRRGQWRVRLHICSVDADSDAAIDAALSNKGLYVLLAAAEALLKLSKT